MMTLLLLAMLGQASAAPPPDVATCDLTAVPVVCDDPRFGQTVSRGGQDTLCQGNFTENCKRFALEHCNMAVGQIKASVQGSRATCSVTCANTTISKKESCELASTNPIAKCIFPACPPGCLECIDLSGQLDCRFEISDDPDPISGRARFGRSLRPEPRSGAAGRWVCE